MLDTIAQMSMRQTLFVVFVVFIFATSAFEIISEFAVGESLTEMADDLGRFALSMLVLLLFAYEYWTQQKALKALQRQLGRFKSGLSTLEPQTVEIANRYRNVMQRQFEAWQLTDSEQDVVILMLKGLSFREIAQLRETREKTVRQQASSVYRKADVASRNELAAWFFEDLLEPQEDRAS